MVVGCDCDHSYGRMKKYPIIIKDGNIIWVIPSRWSLFPIKIDLEKL